MARNCTTSEHPTWTHLLEQAVTEPGTISKAYHAFHSYSLGNQLLAAFECGARGIELGPIATFPRWKELGRSVRKGEKAITLCMPITFQRSKPASEEPDDDSGTAAAEMGTYFVFRRNWFVLAQTDGEPYIAPETPGWDRARAVKALGLTEVPFNEPNGNKQGYSEPGRRFSVSPIAVNPLKTTCHEMAHCILHLDQSHQDLATLTRSTAEVEAESVAMLCCEALGLDGADEARGYIQRWGTEISEATSRRIFATADKILKAGREVAP